MINRRQLLKNAIGGATAAATRTFKFPKARGMPAANQWQREEWARIYNGIRNGELFVIKAGSKALVRP